VYQFRVRARDASIYNGGSYWMEATFPFEIAALDRRVQIPLEVKGEGTVTL
jgi:hypothetical protein